MVLGDECSVIRGSKEVKIPSNLLVRGDLLRIKTLDKIAADCRLIYTKDLKIETSCISGETDCINYTAETAQKSTGVFDANNLVFGGSTCRGGEGLGLVIRTGNSTVSPQIYKCLLLKLLVNWTIIPSV
jgi:P-type E1-E2 ATPase